MVNTAGGEIPDRTSALDRSITPVMGLLTSLVFALILTLGIALIPSANAQAQGSDEQRRVAIAAAMGQAGGQGKVISVKPQATSNGKPGFRVRIITDGRVRTFDVPAGGSK